jgi:DNA mismatch repair protein MutL
VAVISVLPSAVADQIAAGEVVERPASVVKELVENALDAGATTIDVAVEDGGRTLVRVSDDGCGMVREDAILCLARHGTSKIRTSGDLVTIGTFGFRGEALPAICSVSRLDVQTAPHDGEGTHVRAEGGGPPAVADVARRRGTTVSVAALFFNVPARRKFLRSARSEWRAIFDAFSSLALARRDIRVSLTHDGKVALALPPATTLRERVAALWTAAYAERLVEVDEVTGPIRVTGLVARPADVGTATRRVVLSINGRVIRDPGLVRAAESAYRSTIPAGVRPSLFLDLTMPRDSVDVNVHPAKAEVRFLDRWGTERAVEHAVRRALGTPDSAASFGARFAGTFGGLPLGGTPVGTDVLQAPAMHDGPLFGAMSPVQEDGDVGASSASSSADPAAVSTSGTATAEDTEAAESGSAQIIPPLTQLRRTYIMFEHEAGLVLIDQHSAHERALYEEFMHELEQGGVASQRLLLPLTLHLTPAQADAFEANREYFERLGFEASGFGGHSILVSAVPVPHPRFDAERCLRETLDALTGDRFASTASRHERLAATIACKAAVKAGDQLSQDEMRALFAALRDTKLPAHDVHGRSTIVQLSWAEVGRRFGRQ